METSLYAIGKNDSRKMSETESKIIFGGIKGSLGSLIALCAVKPKAAYHLSMAIAARLVGNMQGYEESKGRMICALMSMELAGYRVACDGIDMFFGLPDVQICNVILQNQYKLSEEKVKGRIVVDGGANTGVFSIFAAKLGAKKVYAFEPIAENVELIRRNAEKNGVSDIVVPMQMALGDREFETEMEYSGSGDPSASLILLHPRHSMTMKKQKVRVTTIDALFSGKGGELPSFIKMDIEGFEEQALLGGKKTIAASKPILSFSAYHKPTDKEVLPRTVKSIRPDYTCELVKGAEEDFYCD